MVLVFVGIIGGRIQRPWPIHRQRGAVHRAVYRAVYSAVGDAVDIAVDDAVANTVDDAVGYAVDGAVYSATKAVKKSYHKYNGGSLWAGWCAWRLFFVDECGLELPSDVRAKAEAWRDLSTGAGWWWPHEDFCIVSARHEEIHRDDAGRLHNRTGPSIRWADGWSIYSWETEEWFFKEKQ